MPANKVIERDFVSPSQTTKGSSNERPGAKGGGNEANG
jgi:hypothetical protein